MNFLRRSQQAVPHQKLGGRYKVINQLGVGGFSQTFLAQDLHLPGHPLCVVKQFKPQVADPMQLQTASRLFDTEAKVLYQLGEHPQIPRLLAHFEEEQEFYLVQEFIEGQPLAKLLTGQPWSQQRVVALLKDLLQVLVFVHQQSVIHRDIKPSNLMYRNHDGRIVLIDFGAVKQVSTQLSESSTGLLTVSIGTQGYMPMEQLSGNPRFSSDIYAAGVVCIQALTGTSPKRFKSDLQTGEIVWRDLRPASQSGQPVNPALAAILDRMVCYHFKDRYQTAVEALEALEALLVECPDLIEPEVPLAPLNLPTESLESLESSGSSLAEAESLPPAAPLVDAPTQTLTAPQAPLSPPITELTSDSVSAIRESSSSIGERVSQPGDGTEIGETSVHEPNEPIVHEPTNEPRVHEPVVNETVIGETAIGETVIGETAFASSEIATDATISAPLVDSVDSATVSNSATAIDSATVIDPATATEPVTHSEPVSGEASVFPTALTPPHDAVTPDVVATHDTLPLPDVPVTQSIALEPEAQPPQVTEPVETVPTTYVAPAALLEEPETEQRSRALPWKLLIGVGLALVVAVPFFSRFFQPQGQSGINTVAVADLPCQEPPPPTLPSEEADYEFPDGTRYYGALKQGLPTDGTAIMVFPSGNRYDGEFENGQRNGCGTLTFTNGRSYMGQFKDDQFNGEGVWTLETGDRYVGSFSDNRCHGEGTFFFADGSSKQGRWQNGKLIDGDLQCDL